jgi:hypothetical protein
MYGIFVNEKYAKNLLFLHIPRDYTRIYEIL